MNHILNRKYELSLDVSINKITMKEHPLTYSIFLRTNGKLTDQELLTKFGVNDFEYIDNNDEVDFSDSKIEIIKL